jgi:hypothetical protein
VSERRINNLPRTLDLVVLRTLFAIAPIGTSMVTITATSGSLTHTTMLSLTVQWHRRCKLREAFPDATGKASGHLEE